MSRVMAFLEFRKGLRAVGVRLSRAQHRELMSACGGSAALGVSSSSGGGSGDGSGGGGGNGSGRRRRKKRAAVVVVAEAFDVLFEERESPQGTGMSMCTGRGRGGTRSSARLGEAQDGAGQSSHKASDNRDQAGQRDNAGAPR